MGTRVDALETIGKGGEKPHPDAFGLVGKGCARRLQGEKLGKVIGAHSVTHSMLPGTTMCPGFGRDVRRGGNDDVILFLFR